MDVHTFGLCVRIHPDYEGDVIDEGSRLWWIALEMDKAKHHAVVNVKPIDVAVDYECAPEYERSLKQRFMYGYTGSVALYGVENGVKMFNANSLPVAVSRAFGTPYEQEGGGYISYEISIIFGNSDSALSFKGETEIGLDDILHFGNDLGFTVVKLASEDPPSPVVPPEMAGEAAWQPRVDSSVFEGDGRSISTQRIPVFDIPQEDELCDGVFDSRANFVLANELSPRDKYGTLAQRLARELPAKHPDVLVLGDHPGTLARALCDLGFNVWGIDPRNGPGWLNEYPASGRGKRHIIGGSVAINDMPDWITEHSWDAVIADTTVDGEPAEVTTARNVGLLGGFDCLRIAQTRSMPLAPGRYYALDLPGHGKQGCEVYMSVGKWSDRYPWSLENTEKRVKRNVVIESNVFVSDKDYLDSGQLHYDDIVDGSMSIDEQDWYHWVGLRHAVRATRLGRLPSGMAISETRSAPELFVKLSRIYDLNERRKGDLRDLFESGRVRDVPGIPAGLLSISPTLRSCVATRYRSLARLCVRAPGSDPSGFSAIFKNPRAGYLLEGLSELRSHLKDDIAIAREYRVLPWEALAVLASADYFMLMHRYVHAVSRVVGKPMHTWELQRMLFSLTAHGTHEERMAYVCMKLGDLFTRNYTGRRAPPVGDRHGPVERFIQRLTQLGVRQEYMVADVTFAQAVAGGYTPAPQPPEPPRSRRASIRPPSSGRRASGSVMRGFASLSGA